MCRQRGQSGTWKLDLQLVEKVILARAAMTKYHTLDDLHSRNLTVLEARSPRSGASMVVGLSSVYRLLPSPVKLLFLTYKSSPSL